jgi:hypothetical protein
MDYNEEQGLRDQAAAGDAQARDARRQATVGEADGYWRGGDRGRAIRILHNSGFGSGELIGFCRERGLSEDEARAQVRDSSIDWS